LPVGEKEDKEPLPVTDAATQRIGFADVLRAGPFAGVNLETFDGDGVLTGRGIGNLNGNIVPVTFTGVYTVNADCTGTYTVQVSPLGLTTHASFVIDDGGNELQIIITDPGTVITCIARRQFPIGDPEIIAASRPTADVQRPGNIV
jgi:hypothetical protein